MSTTQQKLQSTPPPTCGNRCEERAALRAETEAANSEYVDYLKQMISSLLDNQMNLSAALDDTREACAQLNLVVVYFLLFKHNFQVVVCGGYMHKASLVKHWKDLQ